MTVRPIVTVGVPVLRQKAKRVTQFDDNLRRLVNDMIETMRAAPGVGLAAPQIGVPLRVAVIEVDEKVTVIVNPEVAKREDEEELDEGCLSVPGYWGRITRAKQVTVKARNEFGKEQRIKAEGLFAQALQHETDHLNGRLYIDHPGVLETLQRSRPERARREGDEEGDGSQELAAGDKAAGGAAR